VPQLGGHLGSLQLFLHHAAINAGLPVSTHDLRPRTRLRARRGWQWALMAGRSGTQLDGIVSMSTDAPNQRHGCKGRRVED